MQLPPLSDPESSKIPKTKENEGRKPFIPKNMANLGFELKGLRLCLH